jgi:protein farnesyltransferase subunit beta
MLTVNAHVTSPERRSHAIATIVYDTHQQKRAVALVETKSSAAQRETERECQPFFVELPSLPESQLRDLRQIGLLPAVPINNETEDNPHRFRVCLLREKHVQYLQQVWTKGELLGSSFVSLDASRTWMLYWALHASDLMGHRPSVNERRHMLTTLQSCWTEFTVTAQNYKGSSGNDSEDPQAILPSPGATLGGFGGGPGQMPHAATTYAAVSALSILATHCEDDEDISTEDHAVSESAMKLLQRIRLPVYSWMLSLQEPDGSFRMQHDGEIDVRATYCVLAVAKLLNICCTETLGSNKVVESVVRCQTFEGGFGGEPWTEAHGGYTFCAVAALQLLNRVDAANVPALTRWLTAQQCGFEGGFQGRTNKLVDGCYSFWQGGAASIVSAFVAAHQKQSSPQTATNNHNDPWLENSSSADRTTDQLLFDQGMLQRYVLLCAQNVTGGLRDKPSARRDFYHSCYNISGLSVAQQVDSLPDFGHPSESVVHETHPVYNLRTERVRKMLTHWQTQPIILDLS